MNKPVLALDIGLKRTGVALSESGLVAQPLTVLEAKPPHFTNVVEEVVQLVKEYEVKTLVVGLPYTEDEQPTGQALKTEQLVVLIEKAIGELGNIEVIRLNEFASSQDADLLFPTTQRDAAAATIILQDYLDQQA